jgi:hypothetical protein
MPGQADRGKSWRRPLNSFRDYLSQDQFLKNLRGDTYTEQESEELSEQFNQALRRPWTTQEFPLLPKWLDANDRALAKVQSAGLDLDLCVKHSERFQIPGICLTRFS